MEQIKEYDDYKSSYHTNLYDETIIKELIYKDFDIKNHTLKEKDLIKLNGIIIFYSNFCSSCKKYFNMFVNIAEMYSKKINLYAINCNNVKDENDSLIGDFKIRQYPEYKIIINGKIKSIDKYNNISKIENLLYLIDSKLLK